MVPLIVHNLLRRKGRTLLTSIGIAVGVATIVALLALTSGLRNSAGQLVHLGSADFGLFQRGVGDPTQSVIPVSMADRIDRVEGVREATPIQLVLGAVPSSPSSIVFGLQPDGFAAHRLVILRGHQAGPGEALVGEQLADSKDLAPGDTLKLRKGDVRMKVRIAAITHSGVRFEDDGVIMALPAAERLAGQERSSATTIAVMLEPRAHKSTVVDRVTRQNPSLVVISQPGEIERASANIQLVTKAVVVIAVLALVLGGVAVANTMMMVALERRSELALLSAVGFGPGRVALLILGEGVGVSLLGAAIGLALGAVVSVIAIQAMSAAAFVEPSITAWGLGRGLVVGVAIGVLGGLYPAWRVSRARPVEGLAGV